MQPPAALIEGAPGSGKTFSLATLAKAGIETFVIMTEPGGVESLIDAADAIKAPMDKLHWTSVQPAAAGWLALEQMITTVGTTSYEDITKLKSGVGKSETRVPAMKFLNSLKDFRCERTGKSYGDVSSWDHSRALCVDSLSGLSLMAMALTIGYKPAAHQGEWGVAMNFLEQLLLKLTSDRQSFFVLTAHVEKEQNELTGVNQIMASTLGRKLAPKIPRFFSEVVYAKRTIVQGQPLFSWSTIDNAADLKNRALPISATLPPTFEPVVAAYLRRTKLAGAMPPTPSAAVQTPGAPAARVVPPSAPMSPASVAQQAAQPQKVGSK